jgi:ABC-2 type transport system ATP-binding protein
MNGSEYAVETVGLVKSFGDARAVDSLDPAVPVGGVAGLLGTNGAGRTVRRSHMALLRSLAGC